MTCVHHDLLLHEDADVQVKTAFSVVWLCHWRKVDKRTSSKQSTYLKDCEAFYYDCEATCYRAYGVCLFPRDDVVEWRCLD